MEEQMILFEHASPEQQAAAALHFEIVEAAKGVADSVLKLGRRLKRMRDSGQYRLLGFETFGDYTERAAGIRQRQAYNYIKVVETLPAQLIEENAGAGVTKLALLAQLAPGDREEIAGEGQLAGITVSELQRLIEEKNGLAEQLTMMQDMQQMSGPAAEAQSAEVDLDEVRREAAEAARAEEAALREEAVREAAEDARRDAWEEAKAQAGQMQAEAERKAREEVEQRTAAEREKAGKELEKLQKKLSAAEKRAREDQEAARRTQEQAVEEARKAAFEEGRMAAGEAAARAEEERSAALARAEELQKQLELTADKETTRFLVLFDQLQDFYRQMTGVLETLEKDGRQEKADRLRGALAKALEAMMGR